MKKILLPFLVIIGCLIATNFAHASSYQFYRSITVTSTGSVASGTNVNFPMLVSSTFSSWASVGHSGNIQNLVTAPNGGQEPADLVFATSSANCNGTPLNFETESYNSSTGALIDWVNVPSLSAGSVIYACYDDSGTTTDHSHPSSTWNSNFQGVWHFASPTGTVQFNDSTLNKINGSTSNGVTSSTGLMDGAASIFNNWIVATTSKVIAGSAAFTVNAWVNSTAGSSNGRPEYVERAGSGNDILKLESQSLYVNTGHNFDFVYRNDGGTLATLNGTTVMDDGAWHLGTATLSGTVLSLYTDGVLNATTSWGSSNSMTNAIQTWMGADPGDGTAFYQGLLDQTEALNTALSPSWILTQYNNGKSPSTFYAVGTETSTGGGVANGTGTPEFYIMGILKIIGKFFLR